MQRNTQKNNMSPFKTIQPYLTHEIGRPVEFVIKRNRLCPLKVCFTALDEYPSGEYRSYDGVVQAVYGWYPPLSAIFRTDDSRTYDLLKSHYQGIGSMKARLQVAYFASLKQRWMQRFLIPAYVTVQPTNGNGANMVECLGEMVLGGLGSKIKIFRFDEGKIINVLKEGYNEHFLLSEIAVRKNFQDVLPVPKLLNSNRQGRLFEEEYIPAIPVRELNRQTLPLLLDLFERLFVYYKSHPVTGMPASKYESELVKEIGTKLHILPTPIQKQISEMSSTIDQRCMRNGDEILMVQGHGDFWLGNILREQGGTRLLLVDWERTGRFCLMHDFFTLCSIYAIERRNPQIISHMFDRSDDFVPINALLDKYCGQFHIQCDRPFLERQMDTFLLEKIRFALDLYDKVPSARFETQKEIEKWHTFFGTLLRHGILRASCS